MRRRATRLSATGFTGRLSNSVFTSAGAVVSLRIPYGSIYAGPCVRVRRSSDNAEQDFSFSSTPNASGNRMVNTAAILTFCGAGSGFVTTWYDQSGRGQNATQGTAPLQPRIVNAGVLETRNGVVTINFLGTGWLNWGPLYSAALTLNFVGFPAAAGSNRYVLSSVGNNGNQAALISGFNAPFEYFNGGNPRFTLQTAQAQSVISVTSQDGGNAIGYSAGTQVASAAVTNVLAGAQCRQLGAVLGANIFSGDIQEFTIFNSVLASSTRLALERSQGAAFGITVA